MMKEFNLIESYFIKDGKTFKEYNALNEAEKNQLSKDTVGKLFSSIKNKSLKVNYFGIEASKGDITKFTKYSDLDNAIKVLDTMYRNDPQVAPKEIPSLVRCYEAIKKYKADFTKAFNEKNELVSMLYTNMVAAIIGQASTLIASTVDYVKDPMGNYKEIFKQREKKAKDVYSASIEKFLNMEIRGDLAKIFKRNEVLSEDLLMISGIALLAIFSAIFIIRDVIFLYYYGKTKLGEQMLHLALFLEEHARSLDLSKKSNKEVQKKQLKEVEKLKKLSSKLLADREADERVVSREKDKEDKETSNIPTSGGGDNTVFI